jgi:Ner family transcriptional regulator
MSKLSVKKPKMDWPAILAEIHRQGMTLTELSLRNDLPRTACGKVKNITHYPAQDAIALFIGEKPEDLWPSRYPKGGPRILDTKKYPPVNSQKGRDIADKRAVA